MGLINPSYLYQGGDTLVDLADRIGQNRWTSGQPNNALAAIGGVTTANSAGEMACGRLTTTTTLNNIASNQSSGLGQTYGIPYRLTIFQILLGQTTSCRVFVGISSATGNSWNADAPTNDGYGFRFSTNVPDTNWQCVNNGGGTNTVSDSGIVASTNAILLAIEAIGSTKINFYINRVLVKSNTTNLPRTSVTNYSPSWGLANLSGGATRQMDLSLVEDKMHAI